MKRTSMILILTAGLACAQGPSPAVILDMRTENRVVYIADSTDLSKFAVDPNSTTPTPLRTFGTFISIADITSINGRPFKGAWTIRGTQLNLSPTPPPGQAIADITRAVQVDQAFEILQPDGRPIGTLFSAGLSAGAPPPGAPLTANNSNHAIVGGTGAFLGARGQLHLVELIRAEHIASLTEDPANRRLHGGGAGIRRLVIHLIPMVSPEVVTTPTGPAVFHFDFSPVTTARPARPGEVVIFMMTNLGPTQPGVDPGQPFPPDRILEVNSPVDALVNGRPAEVINKVGWPGRTNVYRVDVRIPEGTTPGMASLQLIAAFIPASEVRVAVQ